MLSTVLILWIDLGTDVIPAIALCYEDAELDIMTRQPRNKEEHLVTAKLIVFAYGQIGILQSMGGVVSYVVVMFDFGMYTPDLMFTVMKNYYPHNPTDVFDPFHRFLGNTNIEVKDGMLQLINTTDLKGTRKNSKNDKEGVLLDWLFGLQEKQDIRMGYLEYAKDTDTVKASITWSPCRVFQVSPITHRPVCYSTEALKYAHTAYFFSIVITQWYNSMACKTRKLSIKDSAFKNIHMLMGWTAEWTLCMILAYTRPINVIFGTRDLILPHAFLPAVPHGVMLLLWDEVRKYLIRNYKTDNPKLPNWFERNVCY
jgi:sodium/potassium-transporting ATPase subunit alpha